MSRVWRRRPWWLFRRWRYVHSHGFDGSTSVELLRHRPIDVEEFVGRRLTGIDAQRLLDGDEVRRLVDGLPDGSLTIPSSAKPI